MNRIATFAYPLIAIASLAAAVAAHAESPGAEHLTQITAPSATTRAQVMADYHQARRDGTLRVWSTQYNPLAALKTQRSRDEVRAEARATVAAGPALYGEDSGSFALNQRAVESAAKPVLASAGSNLR